jgi:hypothetical protein
MLPFERCFIMLCNNLTEKECIERKLFGDKARKLKDINNIKIGDIGLLLNIDTDELIGLFRACSEPKLHIEPKAWNGRFAAQVRVEIINKLQRIKDATYILQKSGVGMSQLKSGALAPNYPVYERDIGEKILAYFNVSNTKL